MKTAIEKPVTPGGVFDHLMVPQGDEPEFHPSKDPKTMTVQESLEEVDRFLCWNRMTPEEKRAEQEAQRAASHATEQAARDIPCTMRPERVPDTPQDTVWEDLTDAPQDVVRADVLDTSMGGMLEAVPSNGAPERAADTMPDDVPDATEGNVSGREADTVPDRPQPFDWDVLLGLLHKKPPRRSSYEAQLSDSDSLVTTTQIAKEYGCGAKVFNRLLHLHGIQYRANGQWVLYSEHHGKGYTSSLTFRLQRSDGSEVEKLHTAWTQKGRKFLYHTLKRRGVLPLAEQGD